MPEAAATPAADTVDVSVIILTVDRFEMADRTIESVMAQHNRAGVTFEVIVVDNSPAGKSRERIEAMAASAPHPLRYVHEPRRNIARARNAGIAASTAEYVAFIDDDEIAAPTWLDAIVDTARGSAADVVIGPVYPSFEGGSPPAWDPQGKLPVRDKRLPSGSPVPHGPTCNILFRAATCFPDAEPFDPGLGLTGGSDTDLTMRLHRRGRTLVWCADAVVTEFLPTSRMSLAYWSRRTFTKTQVYVRTRLRHSDRRIRDFAMIMATASVQLVFFFFPALISYRYPTPRLAQMRLVFARGLGKVLFPFRVNFY